MPFSHLTANRFPFSQRQHTQYRFVRTADTVENYRTNVDVEPLSFKVEMWLTLLWLIRHVWHRLLITLPALPTWIHSSFLATQREQGRSLSHFLLSLNSNLMATCFLIVSPWGSPSASLTSKLCSFPRSNRRTDWFYCAWWIQSPGIMQIETLSSWTYTAATWLVAVAGQPCSATVTTTVYALFRRISLL